MLCCTSEELKEYKRSNIEIDITWKGDNPDFVQVCDMEVSDMLSNLNEVSDLALGLQRQGDQSKVQ